MTMVKAARIEACGKPRDPRERGRHAVRMDQDPPFQGPYPNLPGYGQPAVNPARFALYAEGGPLRLTFEMSRTEYVIPADEWVEVEFDVWVSKLLPSLIHHEDGITFVGAGAHPTVWKDGRLMPVTEARRPPRYGPPADWKP